MIEISLSKEDERLLERYAKEFPSEFTRAFIAASGIVLRNMRGKMNGKSKKKGIPNWESFTKSARKVMKQPWASKFGGRLMYGDKCPLTMYPTGKDSVKIGWIGPMEEAAKRFQEGGTSDTSSSWREWLYTKGFKSGEVPKIANTPPRPVVELTHSEAQKHMAEWMLGALDRIFKGKIKRWELRYNKTPETRKGAMTGEEKVAALKARIEAS